MPNDADYLRCIGQKLRKLREKKGLTIAEVAVALDKSASQVGSIERADRCPSILLLKQLTEFYQVPLGHLFEDDLIQFQQRIGNYIQTLIIKQGLTIAELAEKCRINYFELAEFFQGRDSLQLEQIKRIAVILNLSVKQIIPETARYLHLIEYYLDALGLDEKSITNIIDYVHSRLDI